MKRKILLLLLLCMPGFLFAQQLISAEYAIGAKYTDFGSGITQTPDGDLVISGYGGNYVGSGIFLIKIDSTGKVKWSRNCLYDDSHEVKLVHWLDIPYLVTIGDVNSSGPFNAQVICYDTAGHLIWNKVIINLVHHDYSNVPAAFAFAQGANSNIMVIGGYDTHATLGDANLVDTDDTLEGDGVGINLFRYDLHTGKMLSNTVLIDTSYSYGLGMYFADGIAPTTDGGYAIVGGIGKGIYYYSPSPAEESALLLKIDSLGNFQWAKKFKGTDSIATSIIQTIEGGYAITGVTNTDHIYIEKLDSAFNVEWEHTVSGSSVDHAMKIIQTDDFGYAITGYTHSNATRHTDAFLAKFDTAGNLLWEKYIGGSSNDGGASLIQPTWWGKNKGFAMVGFTHSFGYNDTIFPNIYFIKTDSMGNSCNAVNASVITGNGNNVISNVYFKDTLSLVDDTDNWVIQGDSIMQICAGYAGIDNINNKLRKVSVYPNPFSSNTTVVFNQKGEHYIEVYDETGRELTVIDCKSDKYILKRGCLAQGIYLLRILDSRMELESVVKVMVM